MSLISWGVDLPASCLFDLQGHALPGPPLPPVSAVYQVVPTCGGDAIFTVATYLETLGLVSL